MQRFLLATSRRAYSSSKFALAAPAAGGSAPVLKLNLATPHNPIYVNKVVDTAVLPGENGEYSVNAGITPIISQLKPGVVQVNHTDGKSEQFFVPGGFAISNADSVTDVSVPEAYPVADFDVEAVKAGYAAALKNTSSDDTLTRTVALIEVSTYTSLAKAIGISL